MTMLGSVHQSTMQPKKDFSASPPTTHSLTSTDSRAMKSNPASAFDPTQSSGISDRTMVTENTAVHNKNNNTTATPTTSNTDTKTGTIDTDSGLDQTSQQDLTTGHLDSSNLVDKLNKSSVEEQELNKMSIETSKMDVNKFDFSSSSNSTSSSSLSPISPSSSNSSNSLNSLNVSKFSKPNDNFADDLKQIIAQSDSFDTLKTEHNSDNSNFEDDDLDKHEADIADELDSKPSTLEQPFQNSEPLAHAQHSQPNLSETNTKESQPTLSTETSTSTANTENQLGHDTRKSSESLDTSISGTENMIGAIDSSGPDTLSSNKSTSNQNNTLGAPPTPPAHRSELPATLTKCDTTENTTNPIITATTNKNPYIVDTTLNDPKVITHNTATSFSAPATPGTPSKYATTTTVTNETHEASQVPEKHFEHSERAAQNTHSISPVQAVSPAQAKSSVQATQATPPKVPTISVAPATPAAMKVVTPALVQPQGQTVTTDEGGKFSKSAGFHKPSASYSGPSLRSATASSSSSSPSFGPPNSSFSSTFSSSGSSPMSFGSSPRASPRSLALLDENVGPGGGKRRARSSSMTMKPQASLLSSLSSSPSPLPSSSLSSISPKTLEFMKNVVVEGDENSGSNDDSKTSIDTNGKDSSKNTSTIKIKDGRKDITKRYLRTSQSLKDLHGDRNQNSSGSGNFSNGNQAFGGLLASATTSHERLKPSSYTNENQDFKQNSSQLLPPFSDTFRSSYHSNYYKSHSRNKSLDTSTYNSKVFGYSNIATTPPPPMPSLSSSLSYFDKQHKDMFGSPIAVGNSDSSNKLSKCIKDSFSSHRFQIPPYYSNNKSSTNFDDQAEFSIGSNNIDNININGSLNSHSPKFAQVTLDTGLGGFTDSNRPKRDNLKDLENVPCEPFPLVPGSEGTF